MTHRIIISRAIATIFQEPEVRAKLSHGQLTRVDVICNDPDPCDEDFRYLTRQLTRIYCVED